MQTLHVYAATFADIPADQARATITKLRNEYRFLADIVAMVRVTLEKFDGKVANKRIATACLHAFQSSLNATTRGNVYNVVFEPRESYHNADLLGTLRVYYRADPDSNHQQVSVWLRGGQRYDHALTEEDAAPLYANIAQNPKTYQDMLDNFDHEMGVYYKAVDAARAALMDLGAFASTINGK